MLRDLKISQRLCRVIAVLLDGTGTAAVDGLCKSDVAITDNGVGDYTLTFAKAFNRAPQVVASSRTAGIIIKIHATSTTAVQIKTYAVDGTTATDCDLEVMIIGSDAEYIAS